jgi:hypothetical protein
MGLSFNGMQSRIVSDFLTGYDTLRRHPYVMGLIDSPLCQKCVEEDGTSAYILFECEDLATRRRTYLGSFFLDPEDVRSLSLGVIWNFI